ncbi:TatD family hydrolase [Candidatus Phytoplasma pini]|uniref:Mg-dependent DNase n=1 Tax=Candidatus Phytoplasma pini TaxID=267362 RepID=A0A559KJG8_9MOLU|nr:TatD family hydrolase [Candidatus Phytoplasma pini]TVY12276.1 Mg-dependent DNase [Candidatus Phytoplasma pini]
MLLIDTHAHLNLKIFDKDLNNVIQRAFSNNVKYFIVPGLDQKTNIKAIELASKHSFIKVAVGIHPCYWQNENPLNIEKYLKKKNSQIIAIGEIGLDLCHEKDSLNIQKKNLEIQINLALKYNLPLILHARQSFEELYQILLPYKNRLRGVFHCLVTSFEEAKKAIELGFYIGIGGIITYEKALEAHKIAKYIPLENIFLETDSPFLTPYPIEKSKRNEPAFIKIIAEKIASLRNITLEKVAQQTTSNVQKLFSLDIS